MSLEAYVSDGLLDSDRIAVWLMTSADDLACSAGLSLDAIQRVESLRQPDIQKRLRELVEVLIRVELRFGSPTAAYAWYRAQPLSGFGDQAAMHLVQAGRANEVLDYIEAVDAGIHA